MVSRKGFVLILCAFCIIAFFEPFKVSAAESKNGKDSKSGAAFSGFGANSHTPIQIDSDKLEVFDKQNKAVYSGDVVVVQGQTTVHSSVMTVFYTSSKSKDVDKKSDNNKADSAQMGQNSIQKIEFEGPVNVVSGTQAARGKSMVYDALMDNVTLTGNVFISDCDNIQRGERAVYDVKTGKAIVDAGNKGRVQGIFNTGSGSEEKKPVANGCNSSR